MTVLFITRKFPPSTGGMENFTYDLYMALRQKMSLRLIKWGGSNKYLPVVLPYFFVKGCVMLLRGGIDAVHVQDGLLAPLGFVLSRLFGTPFTIIIHGLDITHKNPLYQAVIPFFVRKASIVFCVSHATATEVSKRGIPASKIKVIPLGISDAGLAPHAEMRQKLEETYGVSAQAPVLLTVGRLVKRKGVAWFVANVMPELVKTMPQVVYLIAGSGDAENKAHIEQAIAQHRLADNVRLLGRVDDESITVLYNGADIFVQPNIAVPGDIEGFGRVLLEASLCELPVVAAGIEGIKDAISSGNNGILVKSEDVPEFVHEISKLAGDRTKARNFGRQSRAYTLAHFGWEGIASQYVAGFMTLKKYHD
jgi:phosphatidylinositol alpha-1,6-mannosyltransferase